MDKLTRKKAKEEVEKIQKLSGPERDKATQELFTWFTRSSARGHYPTKREYADVARIVLGLLGLLVLGLLLVHFL